MSDDDSFVILGTSPNSMQSFNSLTHTNSKNASLIPQAQTPTTINNKSNQFQLNGAVNLQQSIENSPFNNKPSTSAQESEPTESLTRSAIELKYSFMDDTNQPEPDIKTSIDSTGSLLKSVDLNGSSSTSLNNKTVTKTSLNYDSTGSNLNLNETKIKPSATEGSLAASFLLGQVDLEELKVTVCSQFPSFSKSDLENDDIVKLQSFMNENIEMKETLKNNNFKMRQNFAIIQKWQNDIKTYKEEQTRQHLEFQESIAKLRNENIDLKKELELKMEHITLNEQMMRRDNEEWIKALSEKSAQIQNMSQQIEKLEQHQLASFEFIKNKEEQHDDNKVDDKIQHEYVSILEHHRVMKNFEHELSEVVAKNSQLEDMKDIYVDEINCLKVNLVAAEELLKKAQSDINVLKSSDLEKNEQFSQFQKERDEINENLEIMKTQVELYRKDFEMERTARENLAGEKETILSDLKLLQRRNQQLIEEQQHLYASKVERAPGIPKTYKRNTGEKSSADEKEEETMQSVPQFICPLCNLRFRCLDHLQVHVQECIDK